MSITLFIPLHSFVDLITNSSSELFIDATKESVKSAYQLVNAILKAAGSKDTAENLLDIRLTYWIRHYDFTPEDSNGKEFNTEKERIAFCEENMFDQYDDYVKSWEILNVTPKTKGVDLLHVAKLLESFGLTFEARECDQ